MPDEVVPVQVVLKDESGKEIDSVTVNVPPGDYRFEGLASGRYTLTYTVPDGYYFLPPNPSTEYVPEGFDSLPIQIVKIGDGLGSSGGSTGGGSESSSQSDDGPIPVPALLTLAIASTVLIGNLAFLDPFISSTDLLSRLFSNRSPQPNPSNPSTSPGSSRGGGRGDRLSPEIQARLRDCLKANIERIVGVPSLSELATALTGEDEASITETQRQVRALYKTVEQLYKLINECDPTFIQELLDTEDPDVQGNAGNPNLAAPYCVMVIAERVNVRAAPSLDSVILAQALFSTCFQVDHQRVTELSARQRLAMKMGEDWYPVILPDGYRGYIFSRYVTEVNQ